MLHFVALNDAYFGINTVIPGIPIAGDNFTMTCTVTGPDRLAITPQIDWEVQINGMQPSALTLVVDDIGVPTIGNTVAIGNGTFSKTLSFTRIRTSQARRYLCQVFISGVISKSEFADLYVQSRSQLLHLKM